MEWGGFKVTYEKPHAEFYIDDHGFRFKTWANVESELLGGSVDASVKPQLSRPSRTRRHPVRAARATVPNADRA